MKYATKIRENVPHSSALVSEINKKLLMNFIKRLLWGAPKCQTRKKYANSGQCTAQLGGKKIQPEPAKDYACKNAINV